MKVVFDEELKLEEEEGSAGLDVSVQEENTSALENCKLDNFTWDGNCTIEFDFTPSEMWLDDSVFYTFNTTGLIGIKSEKTPKSFAYMAVHPKTVCAYRSSGYYWNLFGKPQLLENSDLSAKNFQEWKTEEGSEVTPEMMTGLTLVTSSPRHKETDAMNSLIGEEL